MNQTVSADAIRVLLVEDSIPVRQRVRSLIEETGVVDVVGEADSVGDALSLYRQHRPDVLVLDLSLKDGDGLQVLQEVKRMASACDVIVLTNNTTSQCRELCLQHGAAWFFDKAQEFECVPAVLLALQQAKDEGASAFNASAGGETPPEASLGYQRPGVHVDGDLQKAESELVRLEALLDCNPHPVLELDANGTVVYCNAATWKTVHALKRAGPANLLPAQICTLVVSCLATGKPVVDLEEHHDERSLAVSLYPSSAGNSVHCYLKDISDCKRLEQQFLHAQRMEVIGQLASGVAHDLNNILTPMLMAAGLLKEKLSSEEDQQHLSLLETGARRGAHIIRQLLTFGRGNDGPRARLKLGPILGEIEQIMEETFPKNITRGQSIEPDLWMVRADGTQLHQVLMNLCVNARDAMRTGGKLTVGAKNTLLAEEDVRPYAESLPGRYVVVTISDTGVGIPPENMSRIFDPFFTTKEFGHGTGLGLSTVAAIMKSHRGFVTVSSHKGWGTSFKLFLPALRESGGAETNDTTSPTVRGNNETILLVDDEQPILGIMREVLKKNGFQTLEASSGEAAIKLFVKHSAEVRLVLTDLNMIGMDGLALIRALRVMSPDLRVIVSSGSDHFEKQAEYATLCVSEVLAKPFEPTRLLEVINRALAEKPEQQAPSPL